jgi:hypothetical protein
MASQNEGLKIECSQEDVVKLIGRMSQDKAPNPEDTFTYWIRKMAEVRGNGYSLDKLKATLGLSKAALVDENDNPIPQPFTQELIDLTLKTHYLASGKVIGQSASKLGYFHWSNAGLYFLRFGSGDYPPDQLRDIDVRRFTRVVNDTCEELYLAEPPLKKFYRSLDDILLTDICRRQLGITLTKNGVKLN